MRMAKNSPLIANLLVAFSFQFNPFLFGAMGVCGGVWLVRAYKLDISAVLRHISHRKRFVDHRRRRLSLTSMSTSNKL